MIALNPEDTPIFFSLADSCNTLDLYTACLFYAITTYTQPTRKKTTFRKRSSHSHPYSEEE